MKEHFIVHIYYLVTCVCNKTGSWPPVVRLMDSYFIAFALGLRLSDSLQLFANLCSKKVAPRISALRMQSLLLLLLLCITFLTNQR